MWVFALGNVLWFGKAAWAKQTVARWAMDSQKVGDDGNFSYFMYKELL